MSNGRLSYEVMRDCPWLPLELTVNPDAQESREGLVYKKSNGAYSQNSYIEPPYFTVSKQTRFPPDMHSIDAYAAPASCANDRSTASDRGLIASLNGFGILSPIISITHGKPQSRIRTERLNCQTPPPARLAPHVHPQPCRYPAWPSWTP